MEVRGLDDERIAFPAAVRIAEPGLDAGIDGLAAEPSLKEYHFLPSVRGDLLEKLGRLDEARAEFERAVSLTQNARERELLLRRAAACASRGPS